MTTAVTTFSQEKLSLIKGMFCKDATDMEFELFIQMSQRLQLDPVIKQIHFVKFNNKMSIIIGIDGYRLIADRTGKYMPGKEPTFSYDKEGKLFSATSYVKKLGPDGQWHEFAATAIRAEYDTGINQWKKGPHYMLAKCAEALALRKGWPSEFSGTHSEEEMDKAIVEVEVQAEVQKYSQSKMSQVIEDSKTISKEQVAEMVSLIGDDKEYYTNLLKYYQIGSFEKLPEKRFMGAINAIKKHNELRLEEEMKVTEKDKEEMQF